MTYAVTNHSRVRVAFAGSSSVSLSSPLPAALAAELGLARHEWIALGRVSARLSDWTTPAWPAGLTAEAVVVLLTGNDARPSHDKVSAVDRALRAHAPIVVWLPPLPYPADSRVAGRDRRMHDALAQARVARVTTPVRLESRQWARDRAHLTRAGYEAYARQVAPALRAALGVRQPAPASVPAVAAPTPASTSSAPASNAPPGPAGEPIAWGGSLMGTLVTAGGARLPLTSLDALWMARALAGEGGGETDAYAITSTLLRRWAMLWDGGTRSFRTLTDLVVGRFRGASPYDGDTGEVQLRGYSQPVAVQWRMTGGERAERRRRIRSLAWDAIEPWRRYAVLRLFTGRAPLTARGAVHFAVRSLVEQGLARNPGWRVVSLPGAAGVFVSVLASRSRREPHVIGADQVATPTPLEAARDAVARVLDRGAGAPVPVLVLGAAAIAAGAIALLARAPSPARAEEPAAA